MARGSKSVRVRGLDETARALRRVRRIAFAELRSAARDSATIYQKQIRSRLRAGTGPATLGPVSNHYRRSIQREIAVRGSRIHVSVFVNLDGSQAVPYAQIHEDGGTIRPVRAKVLTIPLVGSAAQPSRNRPARPIQFFRSGFWLSRRGLPPLFVRPLGAGGSRGLETLFVGVKSVRIPRRPIWQTTFERQTPRVLRRFEVAADRIVAKIRGE